MRRNRALLTAGVLAVLAAAPAAAEETIGRWRIELQVGAVDPGDSIRSDAANSAAITGTTGSTVVADPRDDTLSTFSAQLDGDQLFELRLSYGVAEWKGGELLLDLGIGTYDAKIRNIELSWLPFFGDPFLTGRRLFSWRLLPGGDVTAYPVSLGLQARFRPTKRFNPYVAAGVGYLFTEFRESPEFREVAEQLDRSVVNYFEQSPSDPTQRALRRDPGNLEYEVPPDLWAAILADPSGANPIVYYSGAGPTDPSTGQSTRGFFFGHDVERPRIDVPSTPYLELRSGAEWQWTPRIALFGEVRFSWARDEIRITADGREKFGTPTPNGVFVEAPAPSAGLAALVGIGGIVEEYEAWSGPQPGEYFLNGGTLDYGGYVFSMGVRFTLTK